MPKMSTKGLDEVITMLSTVAAKSEDVVKAGLYDGAGIVADAANASINTIPISNTWGTPEIPKRGISVDERFALHEGLGISPMETSGGTTNVSIGFDGYGGEPTQKYPKGKPVAMIARSVERGTSFMYANPFMKPTAAKAKGAAIAKMNQTIKEEIQKLTK